MRIPSTQLTTVLGTSGAAAEPGRSAGAAGSQPTSLADGSSPGTASAESTGPKLSTALRIDDQRHIYYEIINEKTGDVVLEIPPEQIRKLGEGPPKSAAADGETHGLDVQS